MAEGYKAIEENKIEKSLRNSKEFANALSRAQKGEFDEDLSSAFNMDLLKITETWVIREIFSIEKGDTYFKLYKEVYYVENPHKHYFDTVNPTVFRRIAGQKETGDKKWAEAIAKEYGCPIVKRDGTSKKACGTNCDCVKKTTKKAKKA